MENKVIKGRVLKFGDHINTDVIAPGKWMREGLDVLQYHTMEALRPDFYQQVQPGDIIVAGKNFGCGSHREKATTIIKYLGISAIVAESVARIYFRNCIAQGIPIFSAQGISEIVEEGEELEIVISEHEIVIRNVNKHKEVQVPPLPHTMNKILETGGVYELLKQRLSQEGLR